MRWVLPINPSRTVRLPIVLPRAGRATVVLERDGSVLMLPVEKPRATHAIRGELVDRGGELRWTTEGAAERLTPVEFEMVEAMVRTVCYRVLSRAYWSPGAPWNREES